MGPLARWVGPLGVGGEYASAKVYNKDMRMARAGIALCVMAGAAHGWAQEQPVPEAHGGDASRASPWQSARGFGGVRTHHMFAHSVVGVREVQDLSRLQCKNGQRATLLYQVWIGRS